MNESFDFNKVRDNKPSIAGVIKNSAISLIEENVLPLFNNLRPDYKERYKFIPEHRFIGNKCELLYQNEVIIDFTFGYDFIEEMNVYDTTRLTVVGYNGYIQDVSVIFYVVRQIPMPINRLNFCYDSSKYPAYKFEGDIAHDEMRDLTRIMEDYTDSLPEHITFNSKYIDLHNLRFENENAIKKFLYKIRKDNGEQKYEIKQCIFITETPPEFRGLLNTPRSKGITSKLIRKYIKAPINTLLEGFDFDTINKEKPKLNIFEKFYKILETPVNKLSKDDRIFIKSMKDNMPIYKVNSKKELKTIISRATKLFGNKCDLNWIDVSSITDMSNIFAGSSLDKKYNKFNGDISQWDVSNVTDMRGMFRASMFNGDISQWDVSNVTNMSCMFDNSVFNQDISQWNVSNVTNMCAMFGYSVFNQDISQWDVSNVTNMFDMFEYSEFNGDISNWDVRNVKDMYSMFAHSNFNGDISNWNINNDTDKRYMFDKCKIKNIYKPKKKKKVEEGFDFGSIDKKKIIPSLSMKDKVLLFDNFLKDLYDKHVLTGMQYGNKYFSDAWSKAKLDQEFNGTYYKCEADGDHLNVELNYMNLYFQSPEDYNQFCEDIKIFKNIRINGQLSIYMKTLSLRMQRLENFGELGKTITFVKELDINNFILHDFEGMPEVKSFKANNSTIFTFNGFKYKDAVKDIELYYKPGQHCVIDWTGFPKKLYGIFSYKLNIDSDSLAAYTMAFERQLTTLSGFPDDFMYISDPENVMHVGQPNFVDINMEKWQRDKIKLHIMDLLLQSFPNKQKRDKLYKRLTKIYRYR